MNDTTLPPELRPTQIFCQVGTRLRFKALAHIDKRTLSGYLDVIAHKLEDEIPPKAFREAIRLVAGNDEGA